MKKRPFDSLTFLLPSRIIKDKHLTKKDVKTIKDNLAKSFSTVYLLASIVLTLLVTVLAIYMYIDTKGDIFKICGEEAFVGMISVVAGGFITVLLIALSKMVKDKKTSSILIRIGCDLLYVCVCSYMIACIYSDAKMGFTNKTEALSPGIIFVAILIIIQSMYWIDALVLDFGATFAIIGVSLWCADKYGMQGVYYYALTAVVFPLVCYLVVALLFYAETQRYKEELENERLHNRAYYDSLTLCKNRHSLNEFLKENKSRWEGTVNINLLMALFDIDDFRLYNNQFSHLGGDYCLKSICDAIRREFPSPNLDFFRYGGEEFLLFFELNDPKNATNILDKVRGAISGLDITAPEGAPKKNVTISVGGLLIENIDIFDFEKEMKTVDDYLYKAKASGKDAICYNGSIIN